MRARLAYGAVAVALSGLLAGCGATAAEPPQVPVSETPRLPSIAEQQQAVGAPTANGYRVRIPSLGVNQSLLRLGLNGDGTLAVPPLDTPEAVGVYDRGPMPGEIGPSVLLSHVNGNGRPGGFARLASLREGGVVETDTPQGTVRFVVYKVLQTPKNEFRTADVYSNTDGPELRLVTCTGAMDSTSHNYTDNLVVFARKA